MTTVLEVTVVGTPAPQGSKQGFIRGGRVALVESSKAVAPWREAIVTAAVEAARATEWTPPVTASVHVTFYLRRPPSAPKRRTLPNVKPDLDKLVRATFDALTTAGVVTDDATICELHAHKVYALAGQPTGATIFLADADGWPS